MACSHDDAGDGGWATASAVVFSMALALTATALSGLASAELRSARAGLDRVHAEYALDGAQKAADVAALETDKAVRLRWSLSTDDGQFDVLAEPEAAKLSLAAAAALDDKALAKLGVVDSAALRDRLTAASGKQTPVPELDAAPLWRDCAASVVSRFGEAKDLALASPATPNQVKFDWRLGEVWRLRVTDKTGWTDDRLVRFVGDPLRPAAVIERSFTRQSRDPSCETAFGA